MKAKRINIPIYCGDFIIEYTDDFEAINKKYKTNICDKYSACVFVPEGRFATTVVWFSKKHTTNSVIAHECTHLVNQVFRDNGVLLDIDNEEPQAYLMGWFFEQIEKFLNKNK